MVIWIIGKSGSGKSYLAKSLVRCLKKKTNNVFWIDGDKFRKKYSKDLGYSIRDRRINSKRIQKYCKIKEKLDKVVVCSILSIFINHQKQNKKIFDKYFQVYVDAKTNIIEKRNKPTWLPPQPFLSLGVRTRLMYERFRSKLDL